MDNNKENAHGGGSVERRLKACLAAGFVVSAFEGGAEVRFPCASLRR